MNTPRSLPCFARQLALPLVLAVTVITHANQNLAGNVTVTGGAATGNLNVTGAIDSDGNTFTFGTQGTSFGGALIYLDNNTDTLAFSINRSPASWLWQHNASIPAMRLDSAHQLLLYQANGTAVGITLTPVSNRLSLGTATLTGSGTGLTAGGAFTSTGAFTASAGITNTTGAFTGGATGLTFNAGGTNQAVNINASGTGNVNIGTLAGSSGSVILGSATVPTLTGNLRPLAQNTYDLGTAALRWHAIYIQGATTTGSVVVDSGSVSGGVAGLALTAGGANQSISLAANGTGNVAVQSPLVVDTTGLAIARFTRNSTTPAGVGLVIAADNAGPYLETQQSHNLRVVVNNAEAGRFATTGNLLLGTVTDGGNGRLQLASHTTAAGGLGFGSDTNLYRSAAATLKTDGHLVVAGNARFDGPVRIAPQGDLAMGEFTSEP